MTYARCEVKERKRKNGNAGIPPGIAIHRTYIVEQALFILVIFAAVILVASLVLAVFFAPVIVLGPGILFLLLRSVRARCGIIVLRAAGGQDDEAAAWRIILPRVTVQRRGAVTPVGSVDVWHESAVLNSAGRLAVITLPAIAVRPSQVAGPDRAAGLAASTRRRGIDSMLVSVAIGWRGALMLRRPDRERVTDAGLAIAVMRRTDVRGPRRRPVLLIGIARLGTVIVPRTAVIRLRRSDMLVSIACLLISIA